MATKEDILESIASMTVLELSELLKEFEEKFGVTAAAPMAVAAAAAAGGGAAAEAEEEKDEFDVMLVEAGDKKIQVIKEVRAAHQPRSQGGQGSGGRCPQRHPGEGQQGRRREGEGVPRRGRRQGRAQVRARTPLSERIVRSPAPRPGSFAFRPGSGTAGRDHPFGGLAGDRRDHVEVAVVVQDGEPGELRCGGDEEVVDRETVPTGLGELALDLDGSVRGGVAAGDPRAGSAGRRGPGCGPRRCGR